jgi:PTS system mannose-specific IIC component
MLAIQFDVMVKMLNSVFSHKAQSAMKKGEYKKMNMWLLLGPIFFGLKQIIPTALMVFFGARAVNVILDIIPQWVTNGLNVAGGMLPVIGVALLLRYMPTKKYLTFLIVGFILSAYIQLPVMAVGLLGFSAAYMVFNIQMHKLDTAVANYNSGVQGDDYDE